MSSNRLYLRLYSGLSDKLICALNLLLSLLGIWLSTLPQNGKPFSLSYFLLTFVMMMVSGFFSYYFLKSFLSPILQVYVNEVIISTYRRKVIKINAVDKLVINHGIAEMSYTDNASRKSLRFSIHNSKEMSVIEEGRLRL